VTFRNLALQFPLLFFGLMLLATSAVRAIAGDRLVPSRTLWKWFGLTVVAVLLAIAGAYLIWPVLPWGFSAVGPATGAVAARGLPVYPELDAAQRYGMLYGPLAYLKFVPFYAVFGRSLTSAKLTGVLALLITLSAAYYVGRRYARREEAILGLGAGALALLFFHFSSFDATTDPSLVASTAAGVVGALHHRRAVAVSTLGVIAGVVPNLKLTAACAVLPLAVLVWMRYGWRSVAAAAPLGGVVFFLPFLLPNVSLANYIDLLSLVAREGVTLDAVSRNLQWASLLLLPVLVVRPTGRPAEPMASVYVLSIAIALVIAAVTGGKIGSGNWHLMPLLPFVIHAFFWRRALLPGEARPAAERRIATLAAPFALTLLAFILFAGGGTVSQVRREFGLVPRHSRTIAELRDIARRYGDGTIEIGYGERLDEATLFRALLVLDGHPHTVDRFALEEYQLVGVGIPEATLQYLEACETRTWLIPSGQKPFLEPSRLFVNFYHQSRPVFPERFRDLFSRRYRLVERGDLFDVWSCTHE